MCLDPSDRDESDHSLYGLIGMLDDAEAERVREASKRFRESLDASMESTDSQTNSS